MPKGYEITIPSRGMRKGRCTLVLEKNTWYPIGSTIDLGGCKIYRAGKIGEQGICYIWQKPDRKEFTPIAQHSVDQGNILQLETPLSVVLENGFLGAKESEAVIHGGFLNLWHRNWDEKGYILELYLLCRVKNPGFFQAPNPDAHGQLAEFEWLRIEFTRPRRPRATIEEYQRVIPLLRMRLHNRLLMLTTRDNELVEGLHQFDQLCFHGQIEILESVLYACTLPEQLSTNGGDQTHSVKVARNQLQ